MQSFHFQIHSFNKFTVYTEMIYHCLQMFPMALVCGNTSIMKPSERDPGATMMLAELAVEAGFPPGTVNVIHGQHESVYIKSLYCLHEPISF